MSTYRTGNHHGVTIVREGDVITQGRLGPNEPMMPRESHGDELVAVVVNGDRELADRICALLNREETSDIVIAYPRTEGRGYPAVPDSCTCTIAGPDPACPVHQGRKARAPRPPYLGPGCICDGSGRTCPRHGVVP